MSIMQGLRVDLGDALEVLNEVEIVEKIFMSELLKRDERLEGLSPLSIAFSPLLVLLHTHRTARSRVASRAAINGRSLFTHLATDRPSSLFGFSSFLSLFFFLFSILFSFL